MFKIKILYLKSQIAQVDIRPQYRNKNSTSADFSFSPWLGCRWFCHVDDDTYVNVPALVTLLQQYNDTGDWYLGKPSLSYPLKTRDLDGDGVSLTDSAGVIFWPHGQ